MNKLMRTIESHMSSFESHGQGKLSATFSFPPDFAGFQGHFPGNPVLPAVCIIQAVMAMAVKQLGKHIELKKISSAKWFAPTGPDEVLSFLVHVMPDASGGATLKAKVARATDKVADLLLTIDGLGPEGGTHP